MTPSSYAPLNPVATYAPWLADIEFERAWRAIAGFTLVDVYRCYELWSLVEQSQKVPGSFLEVGVWRGGTGALIAHKARLCGITAPIYLCDTFKGVVKAAGGDGQYRGGEHADTSRPLVEALLSQRFKLENTRILEGIFPDDTGQLVAAETFRLCHIDVDVYQSAKDVLDWVWPRMPNGGVVVFDDYGFEACAGVTRLVNELRPLADRLVIHNLNGHAVMIKLAPSAVPSVELAGDHRAGNSQSGA